MAKKVRMKATANLNADSFFGQKKPLTLRELLKQALEKKLQQNCKTEED